MHNKVVATFKSAVRGKQNTIYFKLQQSIVTQCVDRGKYTKLTTVVIRKTCWLLVHLDVNDE